VAMEPTPDPSQSTPQSSSSASRASARLQQSHSESAVQPRLEAIPRRSQASRSAPAKVITSDHSNSQHSTPSHAKVAIPRQRPGVGHRHTRRVAKACESCRQRKTKCSGDTPVCRQCRELKVRCQYPDGMREKTKR
jgi:hypothetical protein